MGYLHKPTQQLPHRIRRHVTVSQISCVKLCHILTQLRQLGVREGAVGRKRQTQLLDPGDGSVVQEEGLLIQRVDPRFLSILVKWILMGYRITCNLEINWGDTYKQIFSD